MEKAEKSKGRAAQPGKNLKVTTSDNTYNSIVIVLMALQFATIVALCIGFSVEISNLKTEMNEFKQSIRDGQDGPESIEISREFLELIDRQTEQVDLQGNFSPLMDFEELLRVTDMNSRVEQDKKQGSRVKRLASAEVLSVSFDECLRLVRNLQLLVQGQVTLINALSGQIIDDIASLNDTTQRLDDNLQQVNATLSQRVGDVEVLAEDTVRRLEMLGLATFPASSCAGLVYNLPSGKYFVKNSNGSAVYVYCNMELKCGDFVGGWQEVVAVEIRRRCPRRFELEEFDRLRVCIPKDSGCVAIPRPFPTYDVTYSRVCGKLIGYQLGTPDAFQPSIDDPSVTLSDQYLDGISLTHGNFSTHIWSFAAGNTDTDSSTSGCPCNDGSTATAPSFINDHYFCESGASSLADGPVFVDDRLWDGKGCPGDEGQCCNFNNPPWFFRELDQATIDPIEMRVCNTVMEEVTAFEIVELYIRP